MVTTSLRRLKVRLSTLVDDDINTVAYIAVIGCGTLVCFPFGALRGQSSKPTGSISNAKTIYNQQASTKYGL
jgi:hypothetical protein